jgi:AcrR family transcriptional regulator
VSTKRTKPEDRRVRRTLDTLRDAMINLMRERGWDSLSVQDICDRANVGRSTFYNHFADKEDLLVKGFGTLRDALSGGVRRQASGETPPLAFVRGLVEHVGENLRLSQAFVGKRSGHFVARQFRQMVLELVQDDLARFAPAGPLREAAGHFVAGAFCEMLAWWLDGPKRAWTLQDLEANFLELVRPVVTALRRG